MASQARHACTIISASALLWNPQGRLLLVKERSTGTWDVPGGYSKKHESPRDACKRELYEELHIKRDLLHLLVVDWAPLPGVGDKLLFLFDGGWLDQTLMASIKLDKEELEEWALFDPESALSILPRRIQRRVHSGLRARDQGITIYLENDGSEVSL